MAITDQGALPRDLLLVEDDPTMRTLVTTWLRFDLPTVQVHEVGTLHEALDALHASDHPIDVVVLDLRLPDARGLDALDAIMATMQGTLPIPVIILTGAVENGLSDVNDLWRVLRHGADDLVIKLQENIRVSLRCAILAGWERYQYRARQIQTWMQKSFFNE